MLLIAVSILILAMIATGTGIEMKMELYVGPFSHEDDEDLHEE